MLEYAFERYYQKTALMGTPASCANMIEAVRDAGVDEIACLIDFGADPAAIVRSLHHLDELRRGPAPAAAI
jgi:alkanesulfonate monooxygenase SsuD/methylene tetrahydromethanopterin reductase-like flavin-dependent oxidoreductase (luciferase family)